MNKISSFYKQEVDEIFTFNHPEIWENQSALNQNYRNLMDRHGETFFSPLNPIFLFSLKNVEALCYFSKTMSRDGVLSLLYFFYKNPTPGSQTSKIFIQKSLQFIVPDSWRENVLFYFDYFEDHYRINKCENLVVVGHTDPYHCPLEKLKTEIDKISTENYKNVYCILSDTFGLYSNNPQETNLHYFEYIKTLTLKFGSKISFVPFKNLTSLDLRHSHFYEVNPYRFLFSECYIKWFLLSHGATPLNRLSEDITGKEQIVKLSPFHGIILTSGERTNVTHFKSDIDKLPKLIQDSLFGDQNEIELRAESESSFALCSNNFREFAFSLATKM